MAIDWAQRDVFLEKIYRRSHSEWSRRFYSFGVKTFKEFCDEKKLDVTQENVYAVLDDFVSWLDARGIKAKTITDYVSAVRRFLLFLDFDIDASTFKAKVTMPKVTKIADEPLTMEAVRTILTKGRPNPKMRALILLLLSSGMRISEALSIKVEDLTLGTSPAEARIRAEYAKTRNARVAYVSDEAKEALKGVVDGATKDRLVFDYSGRLYQREKVAGRTFREIVARSGLGEKIEGHRTHVIHFHVFRKFFLTKGSDVIGEHAAHGLCGHGFYMDTYYKKSEDERRKDYLKLMPHLTVFGKQTLSKDEVVNTMRREYLGTAGYNEDEIDKLGDLSKKSAQEMKELYRKKDMEALGLNGNHQKVVPMGEVRSWVTQGWEYVAALPTDEAIVKLPSPYT